MSIDFQCIKQNKQTKLHFSLYLQKVTVVRTIIQIKCLVQFTAKEMMFGPICTCVDCYKTNRDKIKLMKRRVVLFQSRIVRNVNPTFIWVLKRDVIDYRFLTKEQMVNHYCKAGSFTTKVSTEKNNIIYTTVYKH